MKIVTTVDALKGEISQVKSKDLSIGFVPTMGALHEGHLELMRSARQENQLLVVSIFVNPTQFNNPDDLRSYPRTLEKDLKACENVGVDLVFTPSVEEMYPTPDTREFDFGNLDKVMEGKFRPGHFNGVAQVVSRLFQMVEPTRAYFGQKDFQQLAIIRAMVRMLSLDVDIVACPTVREEDGLAMSSRNALLSARQRASAPLIAKTLFSAQQQVEKMEVNQLVSWVVSQVNKDPELEVEYFEVCDVHTLVPVSNWKESDEIVACIAVQVGAVRLIDNIILKQ